MEISKDKVFNCRRVLLLVLCLNFSDWLCTVSILRFDGFSEINPIMIYMLDKPLFCFLIKCVVPLMLVTYIFFAVKNANENIIFVVNMSMWFVTVIYLLINIMHIINFIVLFNMY